MPVSVTSKRSAAGRVLRTRTVTSPDSVNLTALESRLVSTWRRRPRSPLTIAGTSSSIQAISSRPLPWACGASISQVSSTASRRSKS